MKKFKKRPLSKGQSRKNFKKGLKTNIANVRLPTRGGTRL